MRHAHCGQHQQDTQASMTHCFDEANLDQQLVILLNTDYFALCEEQ